MARHAEIFTTSEIFMNETRPDEWISSFSRFGVDEKVDQEDEDEEEEEAVRVLLVAASSRFLRWLCVVYELFF